MSMQAEVFSAQEKLVFALRALYESFGYARFPMRKFEEYDLYLENKSFLKTESVLAFTNANGKLMALKPDVTLSIVKHARRDGQSVEKLYYKESVYRVSQTNQEFAAIEQMGVEYLGDVDLYGASEMVRLAVESLRAVGVEFVLELSHMGFVGGLMETLRIDNEQKEKLFSLIRQKNGHELRKALEELKVPGRDTERLIAAVSLSAPLKEGLQQAEKLAIGQEMDRAVQDLRALHDALEPLGFCEELRLDGSILHDLDYYNRLVFQGYVKGVPRAVLSGGQYDPLMRKFGKAGGGIGFALYLDEVTRLLAEFASFDVDVLAQYQEGNPAAQVMLAVDALRRQGLRVMAVKAPPKGIRAKETRRFQNGSFGEVE